MAKKMFSARLSDADLARLARLKSGSPEMSEAEIIADALFEYETTRGPVAQKMLLQLYHTAFECAQPLQSLEDERDLMPEEKEVLDFIGRVWSEARKMKLFTEPSLPPEAWEK